jgi:DNA-binding MarR family transcriptional regulator
MHAILFAVKRTFHKSVWFGRFLLKDYLLTPSRFDILYILKESGLATLRQSRIREILGVARPTVSRMIKALLELGFIHRERSTFDRRQYDISLTKYGLETVAHAIRTIIESGIITNAVVHFACKDWRCPETTFDGIDRLETILTQMRERLLDKATLNYWWHPDDIDSRVFLFERE